MKIKVVSLNIWCGGLLMAAVIDFLRQQDADVVLLQEVYNGTDAVLEEKYRSVQVLNQALNYQHVSFMANYRDMEGAAGLAERGNAIFSKFPIKREETVFMDGEYTEDYLDIPEQYGISPRGLQHVVLATEAGDLEVFNMHGVWDLDGDSYSPQRQKMSQVVVDAVKDKQNVILAGDTNAKPTNQAMKNIERQLKSVFGDTLKSTFNMKHKTNPGYATSAVDMMFVSSDIKVISKDCPRVDVSDHLPLVVKVEI